MKDGGPAFPVEVLAGGAGKAGPIYKTLQGMSLRDYLAAQWIVGKNWTMYATEAGMASEAYRVADALLAEREKPIQETK